MTGMSRAGRQQPARRIVRPGKAAEWSLGAAGRILQREERIEADWRARAACRVHDPDLFFSADPADMDLAVSICAGCPVRDRCEDFALKIGARAGVWAGTALHAALDPAAAALAASGARAQQAAAAAAIRLAAGVKTCTRCEQEKALDQFSARRQSADGRASACRECKAHPHRAAPSTVRAQRAADTAAARLAAGVKTCTKCRQEKALDGFAARARSGDGRRPECRACAAPAQRAAKDVPAGETRRGEAQRRKAA